jgi:hypothetical protein
MAQQLIYKLNELNVWSSSVTPVGTPNGRKANRRVDVIHARSR